MTFIHSPRILKWIPAAFLGLWVSGCAVFGIQNLPPRPPSVPAGGYWHLDVPFFSDNTDQCGPASLAGVLSFWGSPVDPAVLKQEIYLANLKGSLPMDLVSAAERRGFKAHYYNGSLDDLRSELRLGHPLIAFVNRGFDFMPVGHYVVVTGFDEGKRGLFLHSGSSSNRFVRYNNFLKEWNKTQRATLLVLPPGHDAESPHAHDAR